MEHSSNNEEIPRKKQKTDAEPCKSRTSKDETVQQVAGDNQTKETTGTSCDEPMQSVASGSTAEETPTTSDDPMCPGASGSNTEESDVIDERDMFPIESESRTRSSLSVSMRKIKIAMRKNEEYIGPPLPDVRVVDVVYHHNWMDEASRIVMLTASALNIKMTLKQVLVPRDIGHFPGDIDKNMQEELGTRYVLTPPTLIDGDMLLWETRSVCEYLVRQFGPTTDLIPTDPKLNALMNQLIYYDIHVLYKRFEEFFIIGGVNMIKLSSVHKALKYFNDLLKAPNSTYAVGDKLTLADIFIVSTISIMEAAGILFRDYGFIDLWFTRVRQTTPGYYKWCTKYVDEFKRSYSERIQEVETKTRNRKKYKVTIIERIHPEHLQ